MQRKRPLIVHVSITFYDSNNSMYYISTNYGEINE